MQKKNIGLLCAITFLQGMVFYAAVATLYRQAAGLDIFEITAIEAASVALSLALEVPWGWAADRIGYKKTMILCNLLFLVTKLIFWQADSLIAFLTERLTLAVCISGLSGVDESMLYLSTPEGSARKNLGFYHAAGEAGVLLSGVLYTSFLSERYRDAAMWTVLTYAIAAGLTFFLCEVHPSEKKTRHRLPIRSLAGAHFAIPGMLLLVLCGSLLTETVHCVTIYFSQLQYLRCGLGDAAIGAAFIIVSAAGLSGPLSDKVFRSSGKRAGGALLLLCSLCMGGLALTQSGPLSLLLITAAAFLAALFTPLCSEMIQHLIQTPERATVLSLNAMVQDSLIVLLDLGLGRAARASLPAAFGLCALCMLAASAAFSRVPEA